MQIARLTSSCVALASAGVTARAILLVTRVADPPWYDVCASVDVRLLAADDEPAWQLG